MATVQETPCPLHFNIILLGKSGTGKSASGNTILGRNAFTSKKSFKNVTKEIQKETVTYYGVRLDVYDTPGLFGPGTNNDDVMGKWQQLPHLDSSVPTAFLLVMRTDRFSPEDEPTVSLIQKFIPKPLLKKTWILFTGGDELEREGQTIEEFIEETEELENVVHIFENRFHVFNNIQTNNHDQVVELIKKASDMIYEKRYTALDNGINLVKRPSDLDPLDDDPDVFRAVLSCGHVTAADTLTNCCKVQLKQGNTKLKCHVCKEEWMYDEIRQLAKLTQQEQEFFEKTLGKNVRKRLDCKNCPGCHSIIERSDPWNLCVQCTVCCKRTGRNYEFCWQCLKEWKGPRPRSDRCNNEGCTYRDLQILLNCKTIILQQVQNIECPAIRACPTCGILNEHNTEGCKNIVCCRCKREFCFLCLKLTPECLRTSTHYVQCSDGVAPKQTSIPSWND